MQKACYCNLLIPFNEMDGISSPFFRYTGEIKMFSEVEQSEPDFALLLVTTNPILSLPDSLMDGNNLKEPGREIKNWSFPILSFKRVLTRM